MSSHKNYNHKDIFLREILLHKLLFWKTNDVYSSCLTWPRFLLDPSCSWAACVSSGLTERLLLVLRWCRRSKGGTAAAATDTSRGWRRSAWDYIWSESGERAEAPRWRGGTCSRCAGGNTSSCRPFVDREDETAFAAEFLMTDVFSTFRRSHLFEASFKAASAHIQPPRNRMSAPQYNWTRCMTTGPQVRFNHAHKYTFTPSTKQSRNHISVLITLIISLMRD